MALKISPDGKEETVTPKNGKKFTYEEMCRLLDTDIVEWVELARGQWMVADEVGWIRADREPRVNEKATIIYQSRYPTLHRIVGTVLVGPGRELR